MTEESDAGRHSSEDEPAAEDGPDPTVEGGGDTPTAEGEGVDSEVESGDGPGFSDEDSVGPDGGADAGGDGEPSGIGDDDESIDIGDDGEETGGEPADTEDVGEAADGEPSDTRDDGEETDAEATGSGGDGREGANGEDAEGEDTGDRADDVEARADGATDDVDGGADGEARPLGAVTDADSPPSESAPDVSDGDDGPVVTDEGDESDEDNEGNEGDAEGPASHGDRFHPETWSADGDEALPAGADPEADPEVDQTADGTEPRPADDVPDPAADVERPEPPDDVERPEPPDVERPEPPDVERPEPPDVEQPEPPVADTARPDDDVIGPQPPDEVDDRSYEQPPQGPPDDEEMPLADHIEEMILRLSVVSAVAAVAAGAVFFFEPLAEDTIMFIWNSVIPHQDLKVHPMVGGTTYPGHYVEVQAVGSTNPRVYGPLELKLTELKFASLVGFVLALPVFVYETYRFMRPGLYPHERRYYLAAVPTSLVLAFVGISFSYFIILPAIFAYFVRYSEAAGQLAFALRQTFDLILILMGYMALVFQIPLFIMLAIMMGLTNRRWLEDRRLYFWGGFLGVSFLFVPEPTGMAPILVALTMVGLFEGTLALLRWTGN